LADTTGQAALAKTAEVHTVKGGKTTVAQPQPDPYARGGIRAATALEE